MNIIYNIICNYYVKINKMCFQNKKKLYFSYIKKISWCFLNMDLFFKISSRHQKQNFKIALRHLSLKTFSKYLKKYLLDNLKSFRIL